MRLLSAVSIVALALVLPAVPLQHDTYESIVIFDITQSMDVEDYELGGAPATRLAYAREAARRALRELPCGSRVGWGAFAGYRAMAARMNRWFPDLRPLGPDDVWRESVSTPGGDLARLGASIGLNARQRDAEPGTARAAGRRSGVAG